MKTTTQSKFFLLLLTALLAGSLLLTACDPAILATPLPEPTGTTVSMETAVPTGTTAPTATEAPKATATSEATLAPTAKVMPTAVPTKDGSLQYSLDTGGLATGFQTELVAAVTDSANNPYWVVLPAYTRVTLQGYPISTHSFTPQIFIFPVKELGQVNEGAGKVAAALKTLIQSPQEISHMPFLPLVNSLQAMHTHVQYLDFKSGQGLRYLAQFNQGIVPVNNNSLIYTYQGLTADGKYYVAAVLPVSHPSLPADGKITGNEPAEFLGNHQGYMVTMAKTLNVLAGTTFAPDLTQLDAMLSSLEIK